MKATIIALASISLFTYSCGEGEKGNEQLDGLEKELIEATEAAGLKAEDFVGKIDELLTLEMAAKVAELPAGEGEKKHTKLSSLESLRYEWKSDRKRNLLINGHSMSVPTKNAIELSWVKNTTLEQFKRDYHNPTDEEMKNAKAAANKKSDELNAEGKATKEQTDAAKSVLDESMSKLKVEEVKNLGTYAVFVNTSIMGADTRDLKVFYKGLSFTLHADLSNDQAYNDKKAIETAKMIIKEKL